MNDLEEAFASVKENFPGYEERSQQMNMAEEVLASLRARENLIVEAGTGVGKSFAYLVPAILAGEKTTVSTASIALQDQLVNKDLAFLRKALGREFSYGLLKGKNNYLCLKREREFSGLGSQYGKFCEWAALTETGDRDELTFVPDFWGMVCGDSDDCSSTTCPFYGECFYYHHYRTLRKVDILVVNHHLLVYDLLSGFSLLPFHGSLIVDEAHQLEGVISGVCGSILTYSKLAWLLYRLRGLKIAVDHLFAPLDLLFKAREVPPRPVHPVPRAVLEDLENLKGLLSLENVVQRLASRRESAEDEETADRIKTTVSCAAALDAVMHDFIEEADNDRIYYAAGNNGTLELRSSMVECHGPFNALISGYEGVIMTSATMTVGGGFGFIRKRLGIPEQEEEQRSGFREFVAGSPFDYGRQCMLYVDKDLPNPGRDDNETVWKRGLGVIEALIAASRGRALVLFTSYRHLHYVADNIRTDYPFQSQGDMPPGRLIRWFRETPGAVLLATATFWQGIDVKGEQLSLVIIAKMPFGSPGEPVYDERCRRLGERWFSDLALPSAVLTLRQGFGRLIRSSDDFGVVAILDPRVVTSSYGATILSSLPAMAMVHDVEKVEEFFESLAGAKRYN